jgi:DNA-binding transcriptional ArsR family regulator
MNYEEAKARAAILKALANPIRFLIVDALSRGDLCVSELNRLVDVDQSTISRHLSQLKKAGIVSERREGAKVIHHLACPCILQAVDCSMQVLKIELNRRRKVLGRVSR